MLSEKIKTLRKQAQLSQEQLAEKLHVSRQAITKWETGAGVPDIENLRAVSALFGLSLDELLENRSPSNAKETPDFLFESITEYDIDCAKSYDITFAGAKQVALTSYEGEKLQVRLASDQITDIQSCFKTKIDDVKKRIDVDVRRFGTVTEAAAKEALFLFIRLPQQYLKTVELAGNAELLTVCGLKAERFEFSGKAARVVLEGASGHMELNCNIDMEIFCDGLKGRLDINQLSSTSRLWLPSGLNFIAETRGIATGIHYEQDGKSTEDFSRKGEDAARCEAAVTLNGMKSELVISTPYQPRQEV